MTERPANPDTLHTEIARLRELVWHAAELFGALAETCDHLANTAARLVAHAQTLDDELREAAADRPPRSGIAVVGGR